MKKWDVYEVCDTRRVWIEVFGVLPHGWTLQNSENIASMWAKMVCLETPIEDIISFESMKILIDGDRFHNIEGHFILHIGDVGFRVVIKEASCKFQINVQFVVLARSTSMENKALIETKKKTEIQGDGVASTEEMESSRWPKANRVDDASL